MAPDYSHRRSSAALRVTDAGGRPLAGKKLHIELKKHEFLFGCGATEAELLSGLSPVFFKDDPDKYEEVKASVEDAYRKWLGLFNFGTVHLYWQQFEPERGSPLTDWKLGAAQRLKADGVTVKGHPLIWHTLAPQWLLGMDEEEILDACLARIERDASAFRGVIDMWDVINEVVIMPVFDKYDNGITRLCKKLGRFRTVREMFAQARRSAPDAVLLINDFNTSQAYEILIEGLIDEGVPIDVIGIQSHQHQGFWGTEKLGEVLERFGRFGKPIHFTENTFVSGDLMPADIVDLNDFKAESWPTTPEGEQRQARDVYELYTTLFAHPLVEGITTWDFADGAWLGAPGGLIRRDGSVKPSYETLDRLINHEWHTSIDVVTGPDGTADISGYRGQYTVTDGTAEGCFTLDRSGSAECMLS